MDVSALLSAISNAEARLDSLSNWLMVAISLVVIGLAIETWALVVEIREKGGINAKLAFEFIGGLLITIGVAAELGLHFFSANAETTLRNVNRQYVSLLDKGTEQLKYANLKLESQIAPRRLMLEQQEAIASALAFLF
jgi:hypothetical protein